MIFDLFCYEQSLTMQAIFFNQTMINFIAWSRQVSLLDYSNVVSLEDANVLVRTITGPEMELVLCDLSWIYLGIPYIT